MSVTTIMRAYMIMNHAAKVSDCALLSAITR